jgi:hypothetical protein
MWVYVTPKVPVMEIQYGGPCEASFASEHYKAAKEWIFTTLTKELLSIFLLWAKIKRTESLFPLKMLRI